MCLINWVEIPRKIGNVEINRIPNIRKCLEAAKILKKNCPKLPGTYHLQTGSGKWSQRNLCGEQRQEGSRDTAVVRGTNSSYETEDVTEILRTRGLKTFSSKNRKDLAI